jgi:pimeloyl-ACP methyl ester carboxylesterase
MLMILSLLTMAAAPGGAELVLKGQGYTLPATVELPEKPGPCVVFFAGSGPTDRNWCSPLLPGKNGSAAQLAAALKTEGIGSIRFDKVGSGANMKNFEVMSLDHYVDEMTLAYDHVSKLDACTRVFLLGHSEGGLHAARTAVALQNRPDFGGLMHVAGPAESLADTMVLQLTPQAVASGLKPDEAKALMKRFRDGINGLPGNAKTPPDLKAFPMAQQLYGNLAAQAAAPIFQGALEKGARPFPIELILADPMEPVRAYTGPLLVVSGGKDFQIPPSNGARIAKASPSKNKAYQVIADANHVFKHDPRDPTTTPPPELVKAYVDDGRPLAKGFVEVIVNFVKGQK